MENPFIFGKAVTGKFFVDRELDIKELKSTLLSGQNIVLFSPRKLGKTSLILETFRQTKEAVCIYIDLWQINSTYALAQEIINSVVKAVYTSIGRLGHDLKDLFKSLRAKVYIDTDGKLGVEISRNELKEGLRDALEFPERVARKKNIKIFLALDEFQEIERLNGFEMEKLLRSIIQHHQNVSYIFAGSERSLIEVIFGDRDRPFYRFAKHKELTPIDKKILSRFITTKFRQSGKKIEPKAVKWIVRFSECIPYYVQHICHEAWYVTEKKTDINIVNLAIQEKILASLSSGFQTIWDRIKSEEQRSLLIALSREVKPEIYSQKFIEKYNLKSAGHVRKALEALKKKKLLEKTELWDLFFREWIISNFSF